MRDIKVEITADNKHVYEKMLQNMLDILGKHPRTLFYDEIMYRYTGDLLKRIKQINGNRKIVIAGWDQIVIIVSLAFNPDVSTQFVVNGIKDSMSSFVHDFSQRYVHDIKSRSK